MSYLSQSVSITPPMIRNIDHTMNQTPWAVSNFRVCYVLINPACQGCDSQTDNNIPLQSLFSKLTCMFQYFSLQHKSSANWTCISPLTVREHRRTLHKGKISCMSQLQTSESRLTVGDKCDKCPFPTQVFKSEALAHLNAPQTWTYSEVLLYLK